ncbi:MAG TPA: TetR/AcrR family transcriptional regulator [Burkholderiales bacterium]|nr:TetR/AcrR family transcriptional regulator [Burkholderiales bacterium]
MSAATLRDRPQRADSRLPRVLDCAARAFRRNGYHGASIREIVRSVGMLPGSLYCHFASKEDLFVAVYEEGVRRLRAAVERALGHETDPWRRVQAACVAHLETLLDGGDYAQLMVRVQPRDVPQAARRLVAARDGYERLFGELIDALPLGAAVSRSDVRLMLLGALNWAPTWYRPGKRSPGDIARAFVEIMRTEPHGAPR